MTDPNDPAMPCYHSTAPTAAHGLSKRELFAALAMQGLHSNPCVFEEVEGNETALRQIAAWSVESADALIAALNETPAIGGEK